MAKLSFVDTHIHLWDLTDPKLRYVWLEPDWVHPILGNIDAIKVSRWEAEHQKFETLHANVTKVVHVQAAIGIDDPVEETKWLEAAAQRTGWPDAILAYADLTDPQLEAELQRNLDASPRLRGIRDFGWAGCEDDDAYARGAALLAKHDLVLGIDTVWEESARVLKLAAAAPETPIVIDHCAFPRERTDAYFESWKRGMGDVAQAGNVFMKISGLGMCDNDWTVDSWRPWVHACLELFGVERCVLGTNWPVDKLYSTYDAVVDALAELTSDLSHDEQVALFSANAERLYRI